ncbi:MAG: hypothetical protein IJ777_00080 [Clostridia bacterium]|nr:hypothetical protein [Clostridia bacterium]
MSLKEKLKYFWNVTLGEDYPTEKTLEQAIATDSSLKELAESQARLDKMEANYGNSGKKGGKGNSKIVETVVISPEAVKQIQHAKESKVASKEDEQER